LAKEDKAATVSGLVESLRASRAAILTDYRGLTVRQMGDLRRALRKDGCALRVVKNRLLQRALQETSSPDIAHLLEGPTAVALCGKDPVAAAKTLAEFIKANKILTLKGGIVEGRVVSAQDLDVLATLPPRQVLLGNVAAATQGVVASLVFCLRGVMTRAMMTLQALAQKKGQAAET